MQEMTTLITQVESIGRMIQYYTLREQMIEFIDKHKIHEDSRQIKYIASYRV